MDIEPVALGRRKKAIEKFGYKGMALLGRVVLGKGDSVALGRPVLLDMAESHVILLMGKRGYGKSYTMGVLLEEFDRFPFSVRNRLSVIVIDTAGIFWTLKFPSTETDLLTPWKLPPRGVRSVRILVPPNSYYYYRSKGIPIDGKITLNPAELSPEEWLHLLGLSWERPEADLLLELLEETKTVDGLLNRLVGGDRVSRALRVRLKLLKSWRILEEESSVLKLARPGGITVIDVSTFRENTRLPQTITSVIARRLFEERMLKKKGEDISLLRGESSSEMPLVWLFIDEAHLFAPKGGGTPSSEILRIWAKVGRQPGLGLLLATQQPSDLDPSIITQADIFISHRLTSKSDLDALSSIKPTYVPESLSYEIAHMGKRKGLAVVLDDITERILLVQVRPRMSYHGGASASALT